MILESLDQKEVEQIHRFIRSSYFNQNGQIVDLLDTLLGYHPDIAAQIVDKRTLFQHVFPHETYNEKTFRYLLSDLNRLVEQFLGIQGIRKNTVALDIQILNELSKRGLEKSYQNRVRQFEKKRARTSVSERDHLLFQFKLEEIKQKHFERSHQRKKDYTVQKLSHVLDQYYYLYRLYLSCAMLDHETIFGKTYQLNLTADWFRHLAAKAHFEHPIIKIYSHIYAALVDEAEEQNFQDLKDNLERYEAQIHKGDLKDVYLFAINYCARKIRKGKQEYLSIALNLYLNGINSEVLLEKGQLTPWTFTNVIKLLLKLEEYELTEAFIAKNESRLLPAFKVNALRFNRAELYYTTGRYLDAQEELIHVALSDLNYYLGARILLAKIYYETGEEEVLLSLLASFTIFLKRNKQISKNIKEACLNFCTVLFKIVKGAQKQKHKILEQMKNLELLTERKWLLERL